MTHHDHDTTTTDEPLESAQPRSSELTDKLDEIMDTPVEPREAPQSPPSLSPDNEHEARAGAITEHDNQGNDPGSTMGGGS